MEIPTAELPLILVCLLLSILFSGSETALNSIPEGRLHKLVDQFAARGARHRFLEIWLARRNAALTSILVGNNVVNIAASALGTVACEKMLHGTQAAWIALPVAITVMTLVILIFGEVVPKTFAHNNPGRFVPLTRVLYPWMRMTAGITWTLTRISEWAIRQTGGEVEPAAQQVTEEDIEDKIAKAAQQGNLAEGQERLLSSVMEFDDTVVKEVMVPRTSIVAFDENATLQQILETIDDAGFSRYPVYRDDLDNLIGVLYVRDLLTWFGRPHSAPIDIKSFLRKPYFVPEGKSISELLRELQLRRTHVAIVVDEFGGTAGLVTLEDIVEEVFGEIYDEYDSRAVGEDLVQAVGAQSWNVNGEVSIRDLEEAIGVEFPEDDRYSTVAGFILTEVGGIPAEGQEVGFQDLTFTVTQASSRQIVRVRVDRHPEAALGV